MKKKGFTITLSIVGAAAALALILFAVMVLSGNQITVARCVVTQNGNLYMVYDERPVHLRYGGSKDYETGDKLLIVHQSAFAESYPEQTRAFFLMKMGSGSVEDIPQKAMDVLIETGNYSSSKVGGVDGPQTIYSTVQVLETVSDQNESSYRVGAVLAKTDFSSMGQILTDKIEQEWNTFDSLTEVQRLASSKLWGTVGIQTDTWDECEDAIGFTVYNPLESLDWLNKTGYFGMERTEPDKSAAHVLAMAYATQTTDRAPNEISVTAGYNTGRVRITLTAAFSARTGTITTGSVSKGYATYDPSTTTTRSGIPVLVITAKETNNTGYYNGDYWEPTAYWVKDNILYSLHVFGDEADKAEIQATLDRLLEEI